jgi:hypothetical protein
MEFISYIISFLKKGFARCDLRSFQGRPGQGQNLDSVMSKANGNLGFIASAIDVDGLNPRTQVAKKLAPGSHRQDPT